MILDPNHKIILFDGVCNLCNRSVNFIISKDSKDIFRFATLQSDLGMSLMSQHGINTTKTDSVILIDTNEYHERSSAILQIVKNLSGGYALLYFFIIVPKCIRDWGYDYIAKNRYKWYGKKDSCMVPTPELVSKFL
jgi:predicted DCC family thiol-disulfide oxidoreductase YuxK